MWVTLILGVMLCERRLLCPEWMETRGQRAKSEYKSLSITAVNVDSCFLPPPSLARASATYMEENRGRLDTRKRQGKHSGGAACSKGFKPSEFRRKFSWLEGDPRMN